MNKRERVIDLRGLLICVLEKWRLIILAGLIVGVVFGAKEFYAQYKVYQKGLAEDAEPAAVEETGTSKAQELRQIDEAIDIKNAYFVSSLLGKIDPTKEGKANADILVRFEQPAQEEAQGGAQTAETEQAAEAGQEEGNGQTESTGQTGAGGTAETAVERQHRMINILNYYNSCVLFRTDYTEAGAQLKVDASLLHELVSTSNPIKDDNMITVTVIYPTKEGAETLLASVLDQIRASEAQAREIYGEHSLVIANEASSIVTDSSLVKWTNTRASEISALINTRKTLDKNLSSGSAPVTTDDKIGKRDVVTASVKQGAAGLGAGILGSAVLIALYLIMAGKVLSGRELNRHYGLQKIACVPGKKYGTQKGLDKLAASVDSSYYNHPKRNVCLQVADAGLRAMLRPDAQIALVSDLPEEYVSKFAAEMNKAGRAGAVPRYFAVSCDQQTPESVEALDNCDAAVLVAKAEDSTYKGTGDVLDTVNLLGREVVGSIVLM